MRSNQAAVEALTGKRFPVLDQGWVCLADAMGADETIAERARGTIGSARAVSDDETLLRLMMRKHHGSSFEFPEVDLQICTTFVVWRQMIRHRAGNILDDMTMWDEPAVNELSGRYSELPDVVQVTPSDEWRRQSKANRQGSGENFPYEMGVAYSSWEEDARKAAMKAYLNLIGQGVAKEQARKVVPMGGYTTGFIKMDLRNWLHWLALRLAPDAQKEIRDYARVVFDEILKPLFPVTIAAFEDYVLNAVSLTALDLVAIRGAVNGIQYGWLDQSEKDVLGHVENKRERDECRSKLIILGLLPE